MLNLKYLKVVTSLAGGCNSMWLELLGWVKEQKQMVTLHFYVVLTVIII